MNTLDIQPINKTVVFYCPFEGNNCLVRTGTSKTNQINSCINSILHACSRSFKNMDIEDRTILINKVKNSIFTKISKKIWNTEGLSIFKKILTDTVTNFYEFINIRDTIANSIVKKLGKELITSTKQFELFKIIIELLPLDIYEDNENSNDIDTCKNNITMNVRNYLQNLPILHEISEENVDHIVKNVSHFINSLLNEVEFESFRKYNYQSDIVNDIIIDTLSEYFNSNIYFIDSSTRMPFIINSFNNFIHLNSVILLYLNSEHYEIVGVLANENMIKREFISNDPIIVKMNSLIELRKTIKSVKPVLDEENEEINPENDIEDNNKDVNVNKDEEDENKDEEDVNKLEVDENKLEEDENKEEENKLEEDENKLEEELTIIKG